MKEGTILASHSSTGEVVLVTGAAAGIGWATARAFAAAGRTVLLADIDGARAADRAVQLGGPHEGIAVDMADAAAVAALIAGIGARHGRLDVLVNNAGRIDGGTPVVDQSLDGFRSLIALNLGGVEAAALNAFELMRRQGGGVIVNVASGAALRAIPLRNGYSASKAGVVALTRNHALAFARDGVRVNAIAPGYTRTELVDRLIAEERVDAAKAARRIPLGRMGEPEEIAAAILHLASPDAGYMTGALLVADGASHAYGGSEDANLVRGARPAAPPPGAPVIAVGPGPVGGALAARLAARGAVAVPAGEGLDRLPRLDGLLNTDPRPDEAGHLERIFLGAQAAGRVMLRQGYGAVVNLTSALGQVGLPEQGVSGPEAAAVGMLTRTMACEWGASGIRVNCLAAGLMGPDSARWLPRIPLRRLAEPAEIAAVADFLLSPAAGFVSGSVVPVDGGLGANGGMDISA
ncbi:SDR family oxidoreductase [Muricoccus radiodurans]|uniref:SDR family oxidoreductase n=1 Tax=Muricoccus radiodurans TaxID=2231721 RepID=UPI003CF09DE3